MAEQAELRELHDNNPVQMAQVVAGLVQGRTVRDIAETLGMSRMKVTRWYRDSEEFREMLAEVQGDVISQIRAEAVSETVDRVQNLLPKAISVLETAMDEGKTGEKIAAAAHIARFAGLGARKDPPKAGPSPEDLIRGPRGPATGD